MAPTKPNLKLTYFALPGRAETTRIMLSIGGIAYEDYRIQREQWPELKAKMPYGQVPVLEVDGKVLAQSGAIERYVAKLTGLYPTDAWDAAKVDEVIGLVTDTWESFVPTFSIKDQAEKLAARKAIVDGPLQTKLGHFTKILEASGPEGFLAGPRLTYADIAAYNMLSNLISGFIDGVPRDLYNAHPAIASFHTRVASTPGIAELYAAETEGLRTAYKAGAATAVAAH